MPELVHRIRTEPGFIEEVVKKITVNTTEMFRDPQTWIDLRDSVLLELSRKEHISIWHAGCSTGQEVYSMIILLNEMGILDKTSIYASDLNADVIEIAKKGIYKYKFNISYLDNFDKVIRADNKDYPKIVKDVSYRKYFEIDQMKDTISIHPSLLKVPVFAKQDLVNDPNIFDIKFDLILCRNVIIYFNYNLQNKVFDLFYKNLYDHAFLLLGAHESILGPFSTKFEKKGSHYEKR
ncbi:MAG: hypothetical protein LBQ60_15230 [Bacteroidales bacterium]|nr:hypothetical protein [Bacteroidales bacterium]